MNEVPSFSDDAGSVVTTEHVQDKDRNFAEPPAAHRGVELVRKHGFWFLVREDYATHNQRDWTKPGFRAMFVYRFGCWRETLKNKILRGITWQLYLAMYRFVRNVYGIEVLYTAQLGRRVFIAHQGAIVIHLDAKVGDDCHFRQGVTLGTVGDGNGAGPEIGRGVEFGVGSVVIGPVKIGDNATIAPNCVVMKDVPANTAVFMPPPRMLPLGKG